MLNGFYMLLIHTMVTLNILYSISSCWQKTFDSGQDTFPAHYKFEDMFTERELSSALKDCYSLLLCANVLVNFKVQAYAYIALPKFLYFKR